MWPEHSEQPKGHAEGARTEATIAPAPPSLPPQWFEQYFDVLWRLVLRLGVPQSQVDDVVQEAFIAASRRRTDISQGKERSFLMSTVVYLCSNYRRKAHVRNEVGLPEAIESALSSTPNAEQLLLLKSRRDQLQLLLLQLSEKHRAVFVLYELEGLTVPEIAECLNLPLGTIASRLARARTRFSQVAADFRRLLATELEKA